MSSLLYQSFLFQKKHKNDLSPCHQGPFAVSTITYYSHFSSFFGQKKPLRGPKNKMGIVNNGNSSW